MTHCCNMMTDFINDQRLPIKYDARVRSYYLPLQGLHAIQGIDYCPWCGTKLPKDLRDEFFDILYDELHLEPEFNVDETPGLPEEFKTDEWWRKRGI